MLYDEKIKSLIGEVTKLSKMSKSEDKGIHPKVGALIVDCEGNILLSSYRGETGKGDHAEFIILNKAKDNEIDLNDKILFVTLEPCTKRSATKQTCSDRIILSGIGKVYIGMLDPNPLICGRGELKLREHLIVERFPGEDIKKIEKINAEFISYYRSHTLPQDSLYVSRQVSDIMNEHLKRAGLHVNNLPADWDFTIEELNKYCLSYFPLKSNYKIKKLLQTARGIAFDTKYLDYDYSEDTRGLDDSWKSEVKNIFHLLRAEDFAKRKIVNVGIGNGLEGQGLFEEVSQLLIVDIAPKSLERAKRVLPNARAFLAPAEDLCEIATGSQDIYISLRTFQSSYFGISSAINEAYRVVRQGGLIIISIANGFLVNGSLISGLVIPKTSVVDKDRPFIVADQIRAKLSKLQFEEVGIRTALGEIFIYGRKT